jgi:ectoine hydroxylase-related dioxygenase (phytanoyl-CoA dioxygenase family)
MITDMDREVRQPFDENGFVLLHDGMPRDWLDELRAVTDDVLTSAPDDPQKAALLDWEPQPDASGRRRIQRVRRPQDIHPFYWRLARADFILDAVAALIGPDIRLHHSKINIKPPEIGSALEWHQDWAFIPHTYPGMAIVAICLDRCAEENGPIRFLPGSHRGPLHDHHSDGVFFGAIDPAALDLERAAHAVGEAGMMSIHHPFTVHGSGFNRGTHDRRILFFEYAAADAWPLFYGVQWDEFNQRMVRGRPTYAPRMEAVALRMPYPSSTHGAGKIYDQQQRFGKKFFLANEGEAKA